MQLLTISDKVFDFLYSPECKDRFGDIDIAISCGDLPYYYVEYILTSLNVPMFYVRGNHANLIEYSASGDRTGPQGALNLHRHAAESKGLLLAGVEGSIRYRPGPFQYSQGEMWGHVISLIPHLLWNKVLHGRFLDIFVSHAPPFGIHDKKDPAHVGVKAFVWLLQVFKPRYHFHGHIHLYKKATIRLTKFQETQVINTYGYLETNLQRK